MSVRYLCCSCRGIFMPHAEVLSEFAMTPKIPSRSALSAELAWSGYEDKIRRTAEGAIICPHCGDRTGIVKSLSFKVWGSKLVLSDMPYIGAWQDDYIKTINKDVENLKNGKTLKRRLADVKRPMFAACNKVVDKENNRIKNLFSPEFNTCWGDDGIARITYGKKIGLAMKASPEFRTTALRTFNKAENIEKEFDGELEAANVTSRMRDVLYALNGEKNENDEVITPSYAARVNDTVPFIWKGVEINKWTLAKINSLREGLVAIYDYQAFSAPEVVESEWSGRLLTTKQLLKLTLEVTNNSQRDSFPISMSKMDIDGVMEELYPHTPKKEEFEYAEYHGNVESSEPTFGKFRYGQRRPSPVATPTPTPNARNIGEELWEREHSSETFWRRWREWSEVYKLERRRSIEAAKARLR